MTTIIRPNNARLSLLALAMLSAFGTAQAQLAPAYEANASVGLGLVSGDRADRSLYDQYNGLRPSSHVFGIFDADYYRRDDTKGTAVDFQVTDVLNSNRELGFRWKKQGDWKFSADFRELQRRDPAIPNTGLIGAGTTTPQVVALPGGPGTGSDLDLKTKRTGLGFAFSKVISSAWQFDASLQSEKKEGSRLWGIGFTCPSAVAPGCGAGTGANTGTAVLMLPEPIDSRHSQLEARVTFARDKLHLSAGYYGSFYRNENGSLNPSVPGSLFNPVGTLLPLSTGLQPILSQPVALPPDNQAHQLDLTGSYTFTPTTLLNFKLAYSQATQHDNFAAAGLTNAPLGVADLGGKVATTLAQVGITARPMPKLSLSGNVRYEDRNDQHTACAVQRGRHAEVHQPSGAVQEPARQGAGGLPVQQRLPRHAGCGLPANRSRCAAIPPPRWPVSPLCGRRPRRPGCAPSCGAACRKTSAVPSVSNTASATAPTG